MLSVTAEFCRLSIFPAHNIAGEFDHSNLHTQADTQVWNFVFACMLNCANFAFHAAVTKATRYQNRINPIQDINAFALNVFGIDVADVHFSAVMDTCVINRFDQRFIGIQKIHVLTDHGDGHFFLWVELGVGNVIPFRKISFFTRQIELLNDQVVKARFVQHTRNLIDSIRIFEWHNCALFNVSEESNLTQRRGINFMI